MHAGVDPSLFSLMVDKVRDYGIFLLDPRGNVLTWNTGARLIKGYEEAEIVGRHFSTFYTPEDIARKWPDFELERARIDGRFEDEGWRLKKDGSRFWANIVITALRDHAGELLAFSKITRDISDRKRQEEMLRQSEERFRLLVEGVVDYAIYLLSPEGIVTSWNLGARRITGYESTEIIGRHFSRFYDAEGIAAGKPATELAMAREHGRAEDEGWRVRKDGSRFWARVVVTALRDDSGRLHGFAKVTQDMTQRIQSEALATTSKRLNDFIAVLAHELRNPLAPIRNAVKLMEMTPPGDPAHEKTRRIIDRQSAHLARLVDDLLDVSRITRGTLEIKRARTAVAEIVKHAVETARPAIEAGKHQLSMDIPDAPLYVQADAGRLTQALTNLLNNAARHGGDGGRIGIRVFTEHTAETGVVGIAVRDTGHGVDPSLREAIFDMFVQGREPAHRAGAGLGIGLALARSIVELHHGTLEVASEGAGKGAEFTIRLPLDRGEVSEALPPQEAALTRGCQKARVLVVDDNRDAADLLTALLQSHGYQVKTAHDGPAALAVLDAYRPNFILLDIGMPGMSGLELAQRIRARGEEPRPLLVAVTGWGTAEDREKSRRAGFDLHLVKPADESELLRLLAMRQPA